MQFTRQVYYKKPSNSFFIHIPKEIIAAYNIKPDDLVVFDVIKVIKK